MISPLKAGLEDQPGASSTKQRNSSTVTLPAFKLSEFVHAAIKADSRMMADQTHYHDDNDADDAANEDDELQKR